MQGDIEHWRNWAKDLEIPPTPSDGMEDGTHVTKNSDSDHSGGAKEPKRGKVSYSGIR